MSEQKKNENEAILEQIASTLREGHRRVMSNMRDSIHQARINGQHLLDARTRVEHGYWRAWVRDNCKFSDRMALKYMNVARHYDALVDLFNTQDEWKLTEFFAVAAEMESEVKQARAGKEGTGKSVKTFPADAFRKDKRERSNKLKQIEKLKKNGPLTVQKTEPVETFLKAESERLLAAIRTFVFSKKVNEVASDLDPVHLGILLLEDLKSQLTPNGLFLPPAEADKDATDAPKPPETGSRIGHHHTNGEARGKKAVA